MFHLSRKKGFTLIELLVVVAIIGVLITILIPSLNKARVSANRAKCGAQMKQWGNAMHTYSAQNDGWIILNNWASTTGVYGSQAYFGKNGVYDANFIKMRNCPMFPARMAYSGGGPGGVPPVYKPVSYASTSGYDSNIMPGVPQKTDFKFGNCNHASSYAVMMDSIPGQLNVHSITDLFGPDQWNLIGVANSTDVDHPTGTPLRTYCAGYATVMFLDGHVTLDNDEGKFREFIPNKNLGSEIKTHAWLYLKWPAQ